MPVPYSMHDVATWARESDSVVFSAGEQMSLCRCHRASQVCHVGADHAPRPTGGRAGDSPARTDAPVPLLSSNASLSQAPHAAADKGLGVDPLGTRGWAWVPLWGRGAGRGSRTASGRALVADRESRLGPLSLSGSVTASSYFRGQNMVYFSTAKLSFLPSGVRLIRCFCFCLTLTGSSCLHMFLVEYWLFVIFSLSELFGVKSF